MDAEMEALAKELGGIGMTGSNLVPADLEQLVQLTLDSYTFFRFSASKQKHEACSRRLEPVDVFYNCASCVKRTILTRETTSGRV